MTTNEIFQQSGKQDSFRHILKHSAVMYESSHSQFRTTTGIQPGPDVFDEFRFVVAILTILGVMDIFCGFGLVLESKTGKEISESSRLEFLENFLANSFVLSDAENNNSGPLNRGGIAILLFWEHYRQKSQEPSFWEMMDSFVLLTYANVAASRTLFQKLLAFLNFAVDLEDLFFWY